MALSFLTESVVSSPAFWGFGHLCRRQCRHSTALILTLPCWLGFLAWPQKCFVHMDLSGGHRAVGQHWLPSPDLLCVPCWAAVGLHGFLVGMLPSLRACHPQLLAPCSLQSSNLSPLSDVQVKFDSLLLLSFTFHYSLFEINLKKTPNKQN